MENTSKVMSSKPRLSIGLPVFNGEKYLKDALDSILAQTYTDFELIISDNASTDRTPQICREYAAKDHRIRYYRNEQNLGASKNFNHAFELSSGEYFKWIAHDDVLAPEFIEKCISVLDRDPSVVLCYPKAGRIDEHGTLVGTYDRPRDKVKLDFQKSYERFGLLLSISNPCWPIFGVIRASALRMTPLFGDYIDADNTLLPEVSLLGRLFQIPEYLYFRRDHPEAYNRKYCQQVGARSVNKYSEQMAWWTKTGWTRLPWWRICKEYFRSVKRAPLKWPERLLCYSQIYRWIITEGWILMGRDLENAFLSHSRFGRKFTSGTKWTLRRLLIPAIKKLKLARALGK
jgi:glycosyltransferase involved in cell wall biosynthesis